MAGHVELLRAALAQAPAVDLGPASPFTFPSPGTALRDPGLSGAHERARSQAQREVAWTDDHHVDEVRLRALGLVGRGQGGTGPLDVAAAMAAATVVVDDGTDAGTDRIGFAESGPDVPGAHDAPARLAVRVDDGGGVAIRRAHLLTPGLSALHRDLTTATHGVVELVLTTGSVATSRFLRPDVRCTVACLGGGAVARSEHDAPTSLAPGELLTVHGPVRITGVGGASCLVMAVQPPSAYDARKLLLRRATCHPLLRLDVPVDLVAEVDLYGVEGPTRYLDTMVDEVATVLDAAAADDTFDAWWCSRLASPVVPRPLPTAGAAVRGRFVGGVGVLAETTEGVLVVAGGRIIAIGAELVGVVASLVAGDVVAVVDAPEVATVHRTLSLASLTECSDA